MLAKHGYLQSLHFHALLLVPILVGPQANKIPNLRLSPGLLGCHLCWVLEQS